MKDLRKFIKTTIREYLNEQQNKKESFINIDMNKLLNLFIADPVKFIEIFNINNDKPLSQTDSIKLSLAVAKTKIDMTKNLNDVHKNLKASIGGIDVSNEMKELIYPSDVPNLIYDTDNFLKMLEKRIKQRKYKSSLQSDFTIPYARISKTGLTPLKVIDDFENNPQTNFNYSQYEYAKADLDLQLINLIKNDELELNTTTILDNNHFKNELLYVFKRGLKGEELIDSIDIYSIKKYIEKFWKKNKNEIAIKYNEAIKNGTNPTLVRTIEDIKTKE